MTSGLVNNQRRLLFLSWSISLQVRMQTQTMTGTYYSGMGDCFSTVWRTEGVKAFYRGIAAPMS